MLGTLSPPGPSHTTFSSLIPDVLALNGEDEACFALWDLAGGYGHESLVCMWKENCFPHSVLPILLPLMLPTSRDKWQGSAWPFEVTFYCVCSWHLSPFELGLPGIWIFFLNLGKSIIVWSCLGECALFLFISETEMPTFVFFLTPISRQEPRTQGLPDLGLCLWSDDWGVCPSLGQAAALVAAYRLAVVTRARDFGHRCNRVDCWEEKRNTKENSFSAYVRSPD